MGFKGATTNEAVLTALGFVVADTECIIEKVPDSVPDPNPKPEEPEEPVDDNSDETEDPNAEDGEDNDVEGGGKVTDVEIQTFTSEEKDETFATKDEPEGDTEASKKIVNVVIIIVVVCIVVAVAIILIVHFGCKKDSRRVNQVATMAEMGSKSGAATANNSSSVPIDSEDDRGGISDRAKVKDTERQLADTEL